LTMRVKGQKVEERKKVKGDQKYAGEELRLLETGDRQMGEWQNTITEAGITAEQAKARLQQTKDIGKGEKIQDWTTRTGEAAAKFQKGEKGLAAGKERLLAAQLASSQLQASREMAGSKAEADMLAELKKLNEKATKTAADNARIGELNNFFARQQKLAETQAQSAIYKDTVAQCEEGRRFRAQREFAVCAGKVLMEELDSVRAELAQDKFEYQRDRDIKEAEAKDRALSLKTNVPTTEYADEVHLRYSKILQDRLNAGGFDKTKARAAQIAGSILALDGSRSGKTPGEIAEIDKKIIEARKMLCDLQMGSLARGQQFTGASRMSAFMALAGGNSTIEDQLKRDYAFTNEITTDNLQKKQAMILSSFLGKIIAPDATAIATAMDEIKNLKGGNFYLENLVDALNKEAERGAVGDAGVFMIDKSGAVRASDTSAEGVEYIENKRGWAASQAAYGGKEGLVGSMDRNEQGNFVMESGVTQDTIASMFAGITKQSISRIDKNVIESLALAISNLKDNPLTQTDNINRIVDAFKKHVKNAAVRKELFTVIANHKKMDSRVKSEFELLAT